MVNWSARRSSSSGKKGSGPSSIKVPKSNVSKAVVARKNVIADLMNSPFTSLTPQEKCNLIAEISESILEDPQSAFSCDSGQYANENPETNDDSKVTGQTKMKCLMDLAKPDCNGNDDVTARLATLSLLAIFQDILPSYRIRPPTAAEMAVKVSKETKKLWDYERALLSSYQQYLKLLENLWDQSHTKKSKHEGSKIPSILSVTAMLCLCELLIAARHFNFRSNILVIVVKQMNNKVCEEVSTACCRAISAIFESDAQGDVALEAVRLVSKMIKEKTSSMKPAVIRTFLTLPLRIHEDEAEAAKLVAKANAKKRKKDHDLAAIEKDMKEGEASIDKIALARNQAEMLQLVSLTYFRILKSVAAEENSDRPKNIINLLSASLEGLAKFSHLINYDAITDLLAVLRDLLKRVAFLPLDAALNCILTAFQTLQGPGRELPVDQKEYVIPLYCQLPRLVTEDNAMNHTELAIKCLVAAFIKRKDYSSIRVASFIKRLCIISLHAPTYTSAPLLAFVRQLVHKYPTVSSLLENDQEVVTSGTFAPDVEDPEHANPFATSAWELATLKFHIQPSIAYHADGATNQRILQMPGEEPLRVWTNMINDCKGGYISYKATVRKHPLSLSTQNSIKRSRSDSRFITPRTTNFYHIQSV